MDYSNEKFLNSILRKDFLSFLRKCFKTLNPKAQYSNNWHIEMLAEYLESVRKREIKRLIINIPPRNLKSICVSVAWTSWLLGLSSSTKIIAASYSQLLSTKHGIDTKFIMESHWYKYAFPDTILSKAKQSRITTSSNGFRLSSSVGGSITGEGGDVLIIDDPHNPTYINSDKLRIKAINWYEQTFSSRLNDPENGTIVVVMQRLHHEDLSGYLANNDSSWQVVKLPIFADQNYAYTINNKKYFFGSGNILDPSRYNKDIIERLKKELKPANFQAQYMQTPPQKSCMIALDMLITYNIVPQIEYIIQSWDTAIKVAENNDYSVCTIWGVSEGKYYLLDVLREKMQYPELKSTACELIEKWKPAIVLIEDTNSGQSLIQELKHRYYNIVPQKPKFDKVTRLIMVLEMIKEGKMLLPENATWKNIAIAELTSFPNGKHDDILDTITQLLNYVKNNALLREPCIRSLY